VRQPALHVPYETPLHKCAHGRAQAIRKPAPVRVVAQHGGNRVADVVALKDARRGQHFEEHAAERPDVGAFVDRLPACLFRRHVRGCAENDTGLRHRRRRNRRRHRYSGRHRSRLERPRQAKVQHLDGAIGTNLDVGGLEIAVNDALLMRRFERVGNLPRNPDRLVDWDRPFDDAIGERHPVDQLQDERGGAACSLHAVDRSDVRKIQRSERPRLAIETRKTLGVHRNRVRKYFDRHLSPEVGVRGAIDLAHSTNANLVGDLVRADACARREHECQRIIARARLLGLWALGFDLWAWP
jgi:hypothetical protein